jgi:predicted transglutaminase-like cysteine proteinase
MAMGAVAAAPLGYVEFCERQPADCDATPAEIREMRAASLGSSTSVAAIAYDWSSAFKAVGLSPAKIATPEPASPLATASYDWSAAFAQAQMERNAASAPGEAASAATPVVHRPASPGAVNRAIAERSDQEIYAISEFWTTPLQSGLNSGDCEDYVLEKRRALVQAGLPASALSIAVVDTARGETHAVLLVSTDKGDYVLDNLNAWVLPWRKTSYQWRERQVDGSASRWAYASEGLQQPAAQSPKLLLASAR